MHFNLKISAGKVLNLEAMGKFSMATDNTQLNYEVYKCDRIFVKSISWN